MILVRTTSLMAHQRMMCIEHITRFAGLACMRAYSYMDLRRPPNGHCDDATADCPVHGYCCSIDAYVALELCATG